MVKGLYTSGLGMMVQMKKLDLVTNNIANAGTTGYKKDASIIQSFSEELTKRLNDPRSSGLLQDTGVGRMSMGVFVDNVFSDFTNGSLTSTDNPLDIAIVGDGFFAIEVTDKAGNISEKYSRDGGFTLGNGSLVTKEGNYVLGQNGRINIPGGDITIDESGNVYANGEFIDRIKLVDFQDKSALRKYQDNLYDATAGTNPIAFNGKVVQGSYENSNVNTVREMVEMISINRSYETNSRVLAIIDNTLQRATTEIGSRR